MLSCRSRDDIASTTSISTPITLVVNGQWTTSNQDINQFGDTQVPFIFSNGNFAAVYPQATKNDANATDLLRRFCDNVGVPANLKVNMAATFTGRHTDFQWAINKYGIKLTFAKPYRHNQLQQVDITI
jgi:hypothetical protein